MEMEEAPRKSAEVLRWGFGGTIVVAFLAAAISVVEVQRARREVEVLARTADRSSYLVGEVGRQISRLRGTALEHLVERERESDDDQLAGIAAALDEALRELEPLLQPEEQKRWRRFVPLLARFRKHVHDAMAAVRGGQWSHARTILIDRVAPLSVQLQDRLDELSLLNEDESILLLATADRRLARTRAVEAVLGGALILGLVAIWMSVLRTLRRQQRELREHVARIEQANRDLDAFAGRIAHDVRNALGPISLSTAALRQAAMKPEVTARVAAQLERTVQRSRNLIDGLLSFSRAGEMADPDATVSMAATVTSVLDELAPLASRNEAHVKADIADACVRCMPGLLHIVATNLIGNALKFIEASQVRRVVVTTRADERWGELVVEDTGPGIPTASLPRIFAPFYRVPGATVEGTGIGLATVHRIVAAYGGEITVDSSAGSGSTFRVRIPLAASYDRPAYATPE
jgi:signal transduction histidine kinase